MGERSIDSAKEERKAAKELERQVRERERHNRIIERQLVQEAASERRGALLLHPSMTTIFVYEHEVWNGRPSFSSSVGGSIYGARAEVLVQGQITQRLTVTRMALLGPLSLAAPKKNNNNQTLTLKVTTPTFGFTYVPSGKVDKTHIRTWNRIANVINSTSAKQSPPQTEMQSPPETVQPSSSSADELAKFAELHKQGVLTDEEFAAKKAQLLS